MKTLEKEFIGIIRENERLIYKVCSFYVSEVLTLADLYQEVVHNLWAGFPKFRNNSSISTWIYRVSINTCISGTRKEKKHSKGNIPVSSLSEWPIEPEDMTDEIREMYRLINNLKTLEKTIVLLWLEEKSYQEIVEITGITLNAIPN